MYHSENRPKHFTLTGTPISAGIAVGKVYLFRQIDLESLKNNSFPIEDVIVELDRLSNSIKKSKEQLASLQRSGAERHKNDVADIFASHIQLLEDETFLENIREGIKIERLNVEHVISVRIDDIEKSFQAISNETVRTRLFDVQDVYHRLLRNLLEIEHVRVSPLIRSSAPPILVSQHLLPSDIALLEFRDISGIIIEEASALSHIAIISRSFEIPAIINIPDITLILHQDTTIILDCNEGKIIVNPSSSEIIQYTKKMQAHSKPERFPHESSTSRCMTRDGVRIFLESNAGSVVDVAKAFDSGAEGIGLLRSEFFYLGKSELPSSTEELLFYKEIFKLAEGRPVTIRLADIGADKTPLFLSFPQEENPQLGIRGIRYLLHNRDLLITHLSRILRASRFGIVNVLVPFISIPKEFNSIRSIINSIIVDEHLDFSRVRVGMMIETPSAMMTIRQFRNVDFFSIGTNDLTQFLFAADRENTHLDTYREASLPLIVYCIKNLVVQCSSLNIDITVCGEIAAVPEAVPLLIGAGIRALSVQPSMIQKVKKIIESKTIDQVTKETNDYLNQFNFFQDDSSRNRLF
ncbi:MAG: phosphoenolpyruvate--protein phosphotransferase [Chitinispirillaceae bacterium]|nr:phosphoenolpyruvate--protein phosphotransferase [Chitinispirillaceae bacterium]